LKRPYKTLERKDKKKAKKRRGQVILVLGKRGLKGELGNQAMNELMDRGVFGQKKIKGKES